MAVRKAPGNSWKTVAKVFSVATAVYSGITGPGGILTIEAELLEVLIESGPIGEGLLWKHLNCSDPLIAGYCLEGLNVQQSSHLAELPSDLFRRSEEVRIVNGSFAVRSSLGEHAQGIHDLWAENRP